MSRDEGGTIYPVGPLSKVMTRSLLVYDGRSRLVRAGATLATRCVDNLEAVPWHSPEVQSFLDAQFGSRPFAFLLIEGDEVHVGSETVGRLLRQRGVAPAVARLFERAYPTASKPFGRLVHGREPAELDGTFELTREAGQAVDPLRRYETISVEEA